MRHSEEGSEAAGVEEEEAGDEAEVAAEVWIHSDSNLCNEKIVKTQK